MMHEPVPGALDVPRAARAQHAATEAILLRKQLDEYERHRHHGGTSTPWDGRPLVGTVVAVADGVAVVHAGRHHYVELREDLIEHGLALGAHVRGDAQGLTVERDGDEPARDHDRGRERPV
ncbi:MAG: hypothetical protein JO225_03025 [Candidatus Eremiobacteraeota bacterium]|nr:hypothetical protein [Candidatus Eremiobacteraeota bacterium]